MKQPVARAVALLVTIATLLLGGALPASAASVQTAAAVQPAEGTTWFGPDLDWASDSPEGYEGRLGATPSMYGVSVDYPLDGTAKQELLRSARAAATQGAVLVVSLEPDRELRSLDTADTRAVNTVFEDLHDQYDTQVLVRFAPQMNGTWVRWGQQPTEFVRAFRALGTAVHAGTSDALMVWSPGYGAGYPFGESAGRLRNLSPVDVAKADTNGDGQLTGADDPYGPYWPGAEAVDWVGLSMFSYGKGDPTEAAGRAVPLTRSGEVESRFDEDWGYDQPQSGTFYDRFAAADDRPMLLDTGALYNRELQGDTELQVKRSWWRQVLAAVQERPLIRGMTVLEAERREPEAGNRVADWRLTADPDVAEAFRADLERSGDFAFGPVTERVTVQQGNAAISQEYETGGDQMAWIVWLAAGLAVVFLLSGVFGRLLPSWRYPDDGKPGRDLRLDLFRGFIILAVVITHIEIGGPYSYLTLHAVGAITGAEMFVFLSGMVLGMTYPFAVKKFGEWAAAIGAWKRARKQYVVTLVVIAVVFVLSFVPFLNTAAITTFTDRGTGMTGTSAEGRVYDLYPNVDRLLDYPPPWYAVRQLLLLEMGPWPFNIMGLFVVLSLTIPALMWAIKRRAWWAVLLLSWAIYAVGVVFPDFHLLPSQFEPVFPLFAWQVLFTHGLVIGWYRRQIVAALTTRLGKVLVGVGVVGYAGFLALIWAGHAYGFSPGPIPSGLYDTLYATGYQRVDMQWGRLVDVALVVVCVYAILTVFWKPLSAALGWFYVPLGQASLYVFIWQVFFVLAVASIPGLDRSDVIVGTVVHVVSVLLLWVMVKKKFLFSVVPR